MARTDFSGKKPESGGRNSKHRRKETNQYEMGKRCRTFVPPHRQPARRVPSWGNLWSPKPPGSRSSTGEPFFMQIRLNTLKNSWKRSCDTKRIRPVANLLKISIIVIYGKSNATYPRSHSEPKKSPRPFWSRLYPMWKMWSAEEETPRMFSLWFLQRERYSRYSS